MKKTFLMFPMILVGCGASHTAQINTSNEPQDNPNRFGPILFVSPLSVQTVAPVKSKCPSDMQYVSGEYCTDVKQECEVWKDPPCSVKQTKTCMFARCQKFKPSVCVGKRVHKEFCMDTDEYTSPGQQLPLVDLNYYQAVVKCLDDGKRLCKETEFEFACEGEDMLPYPTGLERPDGVCNIDIEHGLGKVDHLNNLAKPSASLTACVSPFGIRNMSGNVDTWTVRDRSPNPGGKYHANSLKGGWFGPVRNRCLPATTAHNDYYHGLQIGQVCCANPIK